MFVPKGYSWDSQEGRPSESMPGLVLQNGFPGTKTGGLVESGDPPLWDFRDLRKES